MEAHFSLLVIEALLESKSTNRLYHFIIFPGKKFYTIIEVPLTPKYFFTKMNLCTCLKHIAAIFFLLLINPAIL